VLAKALDEMERATGVRPQLTFDQVKMALDVIVPRFTTRARLEHFGERRTQAKEGTQIIGRVWRRIRSEHPELWTYAAWYAANMRNADTRELSSGDFAERMRRKRDSRTNREETPEAPGEEEAGEVEKAGAVPHGRDCICDACLPF
jgi:hypothetical protein